MCERHVRIKSAFLTAIIPVVLGATGSALALDHFWTGAVSRDAADPRNWDNGSATPTLPSSGDIVRIGTTSSWADYVPANQPVLSSEWNGRAGGPSAGWWFVLGVGNQNTLTIDDGAYIEGSKNDWNLRNGGVLHVCGRRAGGGPSIVVPPRFRIGNNGDSIPTATGTLRIDDDGYMRFDPSVAKGGSGGYEIFLGAAANALIEIRDNGILELVTGARGNNPEDTPQFVFGSADPAANRIVISGEGQLLLAGNPPVVTVVDAEMPVLDAIDAGFITTDEPGGTLTATGIDPMIVRLGERRIATDPTPADGLTDVVRQAVLSWRPGVGAQAHDVYLGTVFEDVNDATRANPLDVLVSEGQVVETYDPEEPLAFNTTYYWRVDERAADGTMTQGAVWQFSTEPLAYPIEPNLIVATASSFLEGSGPENTINESGLNDADEHSTAAGDMWQTALGAEGPTWIQYAFDKPYKLHELTVWNFNADLEYLVGFGLKDVTIEYSLDGAEWTSLGDVTFAQGTSAPGYAANTTIDFEGVAARYVRLAVNSSFRETGSHGLSEVRFSYIPTHARRPEPDSGATDVATDVVLTWRAGREATSHDVYFGADEQAVAAGQALVDTVGENRYELAGLDLDATYFWRIDEHTEDSLWAGDLWQFTTQDSHVVDDFESYTADEAAGETIWQTWADGYNVNENGSQVGNDLPPYVERAIVYQGRQSMPLSYDNTGSATYSEATRAFESPQDWTRGGAQVLVLHFYGQDDNTAGQLYVKIDGTKILYDGPASDLAEPSWMQWPIDLSGLDVDNVTELSIGVDGASAGGQLYLDEIRLYRAAP